MRGASSSFPFVIAAADGLLAKLDGLGGREQV
jgi:hypothetical protein